MSPPAPTAPRSACNHRHRTLTDRRKRSTVATVAVARELAGFLWAAMTRQPLNHADLTPTA